MAWCSEEMHLPAELADKFSGKDAFDQVMALQGEVFRDVPGRRTLRFEHAGKSYFAKLHDGVGWKEIFKNLLTLRLPIVSAATEWRAIKKLDALGIPTTPAVAYGCRGIDPAHLQSFLITEDLGDIVSLETLCADWLKSPPGARLKRRLIVAAATVARKLHDSGLNHRDFYICHLCLDNQRLVNDEIYLYLIDLHRVGIRPQILTADRIKDIAAMYFSIMHAGLGKRDILRFLRTYYGQPLSVTLNQQKDFLDKVEVRARSLYFKFYGNMPVKIFP